MVVKLLLEVIVEYEFGCGQAGVELPGAAGSDDQHGDRIVGQHQGSQQVANWFALLASSSSLDHVDTQ